MAVVHGKAKKTGEKRHAREPSLPLLSVLRLTFSQLKVLAEREFGITIPLFNAHELAGG